MKVKDRRKKGYRLENDTVKWMRKRKQGFKRVGMSGQLEGLKGDFSWFLGITGSPAYSLYLFGEAKSGSQVPKSLYDWFEKDDMDFLVVRRDRKPRLWIIPDHVLEKFLEWLGEKQNEKEKD